VVLSVKDQERKEPVALLRHPTSGPRLDVRIVRDWPRLVAAPLFKLRACSQVVAAHRRAMIYEGLSEACTAAPIASSNQRGRKMSQSDVDEDTGAVSIECDLPAVHGWTASFTGYWTNRPSKYCTEQNFCSRRGSCSCHSLDRGEGVSSCITDR
jgi:hypothetical protein